MLKRRGKQYRPLRETESCTVVELERTMRDKKRER
jgi:hypothetical protein